MYINHNYNLQELLYSYYNRNYQMLCEFVYNFRFNFEYYKKYFRV